VTGIVAAAGAVALPAFAAPCAGLANPVYVTGSSAVKPLLAGLATTLAGASPPVTIIYKGAGSCTGMDGFFGNTPLTGTGVSYWNTTTEQACDLDPAGVPIDIAVSDVFSTTCTATYALTSTINDFPGPVQAMTFVVPNASTEETISAEAAYFVFGFGAKSGAAPWTDPAFLFQRGAGSGTQQMIATGINVPAASWQGTVTASSSAMLDAVKFSAMPAATLGILAADVADDNFANIKVLHYQHHGQSCGYRPDVDPSPSKHDKRNVRDGHYALWGPLHFITHVNISTGDPLNPQAKAVIDYLTGAQQAPAGLDLISLEALHHVVPQCAMRVSRTEEVGPLASFMPARSCGCYFDALTSSTDCAACKVNADCAAAAPKCNFGYCEVQ
jgi:ABC-type phosphate transport system substrate-binding protein